MQNPHRKYCTEFSVNQNLAKVHFNNLPKEFKRAHIERLTNIAQSVIGDMEWEIKKKSKLVTLTKAGN